MPLIPGYEDDPLVDGAYLIDEPLFWASHLLQCTNGVEEPLCAGFGVSKADLLQFFERVSAERQWPALSVPLPAGHVLHVLYRNLPGEGGYDYLLHHPDWKATVPLARVEGCFRGPGLCWPELLAVAHKAAEAGSAPRLDPHTFLLLLPIMSDADLPLDADDVLAAMLTACGAAGETGVLARILLEEQGCWGPQHWTLTPAGRISETRYAFRRPGAMSSDMLAQVSLLLEPHGNA
ncbi:hypothetical protein [Micromonospora sp. NBC_00860]|uniref:hypothetical protein n=1 Tax=Micromonospora sp. NBC_00860 TaxID=2975980 RepID=UPI003869EC62|nr:hypothetical protein OH804_15495 [Micromonospora sp. NBC_00860]